MRRTLSLALILILLAVSGAAQETGEPEPYTPEEFPAWSRSLRRAEIITIGLFPFVFFFTALAYGGGRFFANGMDSRYAPSLFGSADSAPLTTGEKYGLITVSISISAILATIDYFIEKGRK